MKLFSILALLGLTALFASCDESATFYSTTYPIVRVEASTTVTEEPTPDPTPDPTPEPTPEPTPTPTPTSASASASASAEETIVEIVNREVLAAAPVAAEGSYLLDFTRHDGGPLTVNTASKAGTLVGTFEKIPGKDELTFIYGEQTYTAKIGSYTDQDNKRKVLLTIDLTKVYQALHPDGKITSVVRKEYTSTPSK